MAELDMPVYAASMRYVLTGVLFAWVAAIVPGVAHPEPVQASEAITAAFSTVEPCRLTDTRDTGTPVAAQSSITVQAAERCGVPSSASAVALTVVATQTGPAGYLTLSPAGTTVDSSNLNWDAAGRTVSNSALMRLANGAFDVYASSQSHVVVDVTGYWGSNTSSSRAGRLIAQSPERLLDTRDTTRLAAGETVTIDIPTSVDTSAAVINLTTVNPGSALHLTAWATGSPQPDASVHNNDVAGQTKANMAIVPVNQNHSISIYSHADTHLVVDLFGTFTDTGAADSWEGLFTPQDPVRLYDSRNAVPVEPGRAARLDWVNGVPFGAAAIAANITLVPRGAPLHLTASPATYTTDTSISNGAGFAANANLGIVSISDTGIVIDSPITQGDVVVDLVGSFDGHRLDPGNAPEPLATAVETEPVQYLPVKLDVDYQSLNGCEQDMVDVIERWVPARVRAQSYAFTPIAETDRIPAGQGYASWRHDGMDGYDLKIELGAGVCGAGYFEMLVLHEFAHVWDYSVNAGSLYSSRNGLNSEYFADCASYYWHFTGAYGIYTTCPSSLPEYDAVRAWLS